MGFTIAWVFVASGAMLMSRLCNATRIVGVALVGIGGAALIAPSPARADQSVMVADNGTVRCQASLKDLTRVTLKDDQFVAVTKVQASNPVEDFQIVNETTRGDIYLSVPDGFARPAISFFGTTRKGFVYKFVCSVAGRDATQVFVANGDLEQPRPAAEHLPAGLNPHDTAARLIAAMYVQKPVEGFDIHWRTLAPVTTADAFTVQLVGEYTGAALTGKILKITNQTGKAVVLTENRVGPADALAIAIANPALGPGASTTAFIVVGAQGSVQP